MPRTPVAVLLLAAAALAACGTAPRPAPRAAPRSAPPGAVLFLPLDGDARDAAGRHATVLHGPTFGADRFGAPARALVFDGADDRAEVFAEADLGFDLRTESYTVAVWVRADAGRTARLVQAWDERAPAYAFSLQTDDAGLAGVVYDRGRPSLVRVPALWDGAWHHVAVTFDAPSGSLAAYRDGVETGRVHVAVAGSTRTSAPVTIGGGPVAGRFFRGSVDDVLVARRAFTPREVRALAGRAR